MKEENKRENERLVSSIHSGMLIMRGRFASEMERRKLLIIFLFPIFPSFYPVGDEGGQ
jgi:hypothetical protein